MAKARGVVRPRTDFSLGGEQAEADPLLQHGFYESAHYSAIANRADPRCFVVGRTGSGKSAILQRIEEDFADHVVRVNPEDLSLPYIADLQAVKFLAALDVHLDPFFIALWKHVLLIEIIKHRYKVNSPQAKQNVFVNLRDKLSRDKSKQSALEYLEEFEGKFWCETDERVREITTKFEEQVKREAGTKFNLGPGGVQGTAGSAASYGEETKAQHAERFQRIVNETQLPRLNRMIGVLNEDILDSPQDYRIVIIDDLDRDWVDERILNSLIRCLFRAVVDLKRVRNLKVLVALRTNIFEHLEFGSIGGQEEKFRSLTYHLRWTSRDLEELVSVRAQAAGKERGGTTEISSVKDIIPTSNKTRGNAFEHILKHTLMRPRDVIAFFNECFSLSAGRAKLTWDMIHSAERSYSKNRLLALRDEWKPTYPDIDSLFELFQSAPATMDLDTCAGILDNAALLLADYKFSGLRWLTELAEPIWDYYGDEDWGRTYLPLIRLLYNIGFVGAKAKAREIIYAYDEPGFVDRPSDIRDIVAFVVHPAFRAALDVPANGQHVSR